MLRAASTLPAPKPYGIPHKHNITNEYENPTNAAAVIATLTAVTTPVPNFLINLSLNKLEIIVPPAIIILITPA